MTDRLVILKLGGSVITDKERPETLDDAALDRTTTAVGNALDETVSSMVIVHGGGSFGHHHASAHGVSTMTGSHDPDAVLDIHTAMTTLNRFVIDRLRQQDVPAVPIRPLSAGFRTEDGTTSFPAGQVKTLLGEGFCPVLHGDVIAHRGKGVTVISGDELVVSMAEALDADRVGVCSTVPGVLDENDTVIERIESLSAVTDLLAGSDATDVSGGMAGKVRQLLSLDQSASIFDLDGLPRFLDGESPGTTIG